MKSVRGKALVTVVLASLVLLHAPGNQQCAHGQQLPDVKAAPSTNVLWYRKPAGKWTEALPLGNGRLGAMDFGTVPTEHLQLNEESLWAGEPVDVYPDHFAENLRKVQQLVLDGRISEARQLGVDKLTKSPTSFRSYEPLADLWIDMEHAAQVEDYRRELDLQTGIACVHYRIGDTRWGREVLISAVDDVMAVRLTTDTPSTLSFRVRLTRKKDMQVTSPAADRLHLDGQVVDIAAPKARDDNRGGSGPGGLHMKFAARLLVRTQGGSVRTDAEALVIDAADEAILLFTAATDYHLEKMNYDRSIDPGRAADEILEKAARKSWEEIGRDHVAEHRSLFDRVSVDLGGSAQDKLPTNERLAAIEKGAEDPGLAARYFQYGRYLLMSSSRRPGRLPANLQGIWNEHMWAPWEADYHLNINLQMNYWPADVCNLSETVDPLTDWFLLLTKKGQTTARKLYQSDGWVAYVSTNPFGRTTPAGSTQSSQFQNSVLDPLAGAWMAMTLWRHYEFTRDEAFLKDRAYPVLKGAAQFILDYLVEDRDGFLVIVPSTSPENQYIRPGTKEAVRITRGSTYHMILVRVVLEAVFDAATRLDTDEPFRGKVATALTKLPALKIGKNGTIQEWIEDYTERDPHHRHVSHLIGLHPFSLINSSDPELSAAAKKTLERRGSGGDVGWSNAWKVNFYARLLDEKKAHDYLRRLLSRNTFPNLLDACFPGRLFQIDGNFCGTAGIAEMLLQSHGPARVVQLLPALPAAWKTGSFRGLRARGAFEIDLTWEDGAPVEGQVLSLAGKEFRIKNCDGLKVHANGNEVPVHEHAAGYLFFKTTLGGRYTIHCNSTSDSFHQDTPGRKLPGPQRRGRHG